MKKSNITDNISKALKELFYKSAKDGNSSALVEFIYSFNEIIKKSINHNNIDDFVFFLFAYADGYEILIHNKIKENVVNEYYNQIIESYKYTYFNIRYMHEKIKNYNIFCIYFFNTINRLAYLLFNNQSQKHLNKLIDFLHYHPLKIKLNNEEATQEELDMNIMDKDFLSEEINFTELSIAALEYWRYNLIRKKIKNNILLNTNLFDTARGVRLDFLKLFILLKNHYFQDKMEWKNWQLNPTEEYEVIDIIEPQDWMTFGLIIRNIKYGHDIFIGDISNEFILQQIIDKIKEVHNAIKSDFENWKDIIKFDNTDKLDKFIERNIKPIEIKLNEIRDLDQSNISNANIDETKVSAFTDGLKNKWREFKPFFNLFSTCNEVNMKEHKHMLRTNLIGARKYFINNSDYDINLWAENYTLEILNKIQEEDILRKVINEKPVSKSKTQLEDLIDACTEELKSKEFRPTLIICTENLIESQRLNESKKLIINESNHLYWGKYNDIDICLIKHDSVLSNKIIVCDHENSFEINTSNSESNELHVKLMPIDENRAKVLYKERHSIWETDSSGNTLSEAKAIERIKASLILEVYTYASIKIINRDAFVVGVVSFE